MAGKPQVKGEPLETDDGRRNIGDPVEVVVTPTDGQGVHSEQSVMISEILASSGEKAPLNTWPIDHHLRTDQAGL